MKIKLRLLRAEKVLRNVFAATKPSPEQHENLLNLVIVSKRGATESSQNNAVYHHRRKTVGAHSVNFIFVEISPIQMEMSRREIQSGPPLTSGTFDVSQTTLARSN